MQDHSRTPNLKHLQSSTPDRFSWFKWRFECLKTVEADDNGPSTNEPADVFVRPHGTTFVGYLSGKYDVRNTYELARRAHDPLLSPHGFFRKLAHKNDSHARQFLETFGPLYLPHGIDDVLRQVEINLEDFWLCHRRFCLAAQLWEAANSRSELLKSWRDIYKYRMEFEHYGLGYSEIEGGWIDPPLDYYQFSWPWQSEQKDFESWERETPTFMVRDYALDFVGCELNFHLSDSEIIWERCWEPTRAHFRQSIRTRSLLASIWQFLGWDTCEVAWRRCPHCQKYFYPRRKDQFYCTSRQQGLASKRDYARRMRAKLQKRARRHK